MSNTNTPLSTKTQVFSEQDIQRTLKRLAHELIEANKGTEDLVLMGIVTRGKYLAERIGRLVEEFEDATVPVGFVDITLYRDDVDTSFKAAGESHVPVDLTDKRVVLVDDVIFSGRSVRAAMDALSAYGRPRSVQLLVLLDRGHRQLPISPDFVGKNIPTATTERLTVCLNEIDSTEEVVIEKA